MEQKVVAKKLWHVVRVAFFMVRKNMSKRKLLLDLKYLTMKRPKLAGKSVAEKLTHYHCPSGAYEFSCSNTPNHPNYFPFQFSHNKRAHKNKDYTNPPIYEEVEECEIHTVNKVLEMIMNSNSQTDDIEDFPFPYFYSPVFDGFGFGLGRSPIVRVTDSPYPLHDGEVGNYKVDEAAEEFIQRFYNHLKQQKITDA